jgi:hypothetical protein
MGAGKTIGRATLDNLTFPYVNKDWMNEGNCYGMDTEIFFIPDLMRGPKKREYEARAKAICNSCKIKERCLQDALDTEDRHAILGGTTPEERGYARTGQWVGK